MADEAEVKAAPDAAASPAPAPAPGEPATPAEADGKKKGKKAKEPKEELDATAISVKVFSPYQTYFDGNAVSISAENDTGPFDILPRHHNFMTLVNAGEVIIRIADKEEKKIRITRGVMHVRSNKVTLFLDV